MSIEQREQGTHPTTGARYFDYDESTMTHHRGGGVDSFVIKHRAVEVTAAAHVTQEILDIAQGIEEGWYGDGAKIDWDDFWARLEGSRVPGYDGREIDLGNDSDTPAMRKIQKHIRALRRLG